MLLLSVRRSSFVVRRSSFVVRHFIMRIILDARATTPHFPGIARATFGLLGGLSEIEHAHSVAVLSYAHAPPRDHPVFRDRRFSWIDTHAGPLSAAQQWQLPLLGRALVPDVWHAPYYVRPFLGVPHPVVTVFDVIGRVVPHALPSWRSRVLFELFMRASLRGAAHIITSSDATRRDLIDAYGIGGERITVVPLAVDRQFVPQPPAMIKQMRQRYDLPARYLLYLGSNKPHKNITTLIEAFAHVQTDALLVVAGHWDARFPQSKQLGEQLRLGQRVRFLHNIADQDVPALLGGATAFVFPSLGEGFGLPPLEAMACGAPVIVSNTSSLPEVVGDAGLLVAPEREPLVQAMQQLLDDAALREDLRQRGLLRAARFTWAHTARQTLAVYEHVAL